MCVSFAYNVKIQACNHQSQLHLQLLLCVQCIVGWMRFVDSVTGVPAEVICTALPAICQA